MSGGRPKDCAVIADAQPQRAAGGDGALPNLLDQGEFAGAGHTLSIPAVAMWSFVEE